MADARLTAETTLCEPCEGEELVVGFGLFVTDVRAHEPCNELDCLGSRVQ